MKEKTPTDGAEQLCTNGPKD